MQRHYQFSMDDFNGKKVEAFDIVFTNYWKFLYDYAFRFIHNKELTEDIVSECFVKLWQSNEVFLQEINIKKFLYTLVKNNTLDRVRQYKLLEKKQGEYNYVLMQEILTNSVEWDVFESSLKTQVIHEIMKEVENLRPALRIVFKMSFLEGIPEIEIAKRLNMKVRSVYNSKHRALEILRSKFKTLYH